MTGNAVKVTQLQKRFQDHMVLKCVDLNVMSGEIFGLLGPSGAGKTTLVKILTGQLAYDSGEVEVLGRDMKGFTKTIQGSMGTVFDDSGLYERLSCYDNLWIFARIYGVKRSRVLEVLEAVGLEKAWKAPAGRISKGMRQRLLLARAILNKPSILFLDEPTSGLDPATSKQIHKLLLTIKKADTTILLTTHNMEEASQLCDHAALLNDGVIVEYGEPKELCRRYHTRHSIQIVLRSGASMVIEPEDIERLIQYLREGQIETIHSQEPNLEEVFLALTGRRLEVEA